MKLLILTQKVDINDDVLGFFHRWIIEFAKHCEKLTVICIYEGEHDLPENVNVLSLGKEKGVSKIRYILNFYKYIFRERNNYDKVFVHMNQIYVILGGFFWRLWNKKIALWYTHKQISLSLKLAEKIVDVIFTASKESFRLKSKKLKIVGHGIDTGIFKPSDLEKEGEKYKIISVGRISAIKNYEVLIKAVKLLPNPVSIEIAGSPITDLDKNYFDELKEIIKKQSLEKSVKFVGKISHKDIQKFYQEGDLFVNFSDTGSIDKAILEAMSCGLHVLTSNEAFKNILSEKSFTSKDPQKIADKIDFLLHSGRDKKLREYVKQNHSLDNLIKKIKEIL